MKATIFRAIGLGLALTMLLAPFTASVSAAPVPRLRRETSPSLRAEPQAEGSVEPYSHLRRRGCIRRWS